jgi:hypothetical protein
LGDLHKEKYPNGNFMDNLGFFGGDLQSHLKHSSPQGQEDIQKALAAVKEAV